MEIFKRIFESSNFVNIPKVYKDYSTKKLITMTWLDGKPLDEIIKYSKNKKIYLKKLLKIFLMRGIRHFINFVLFMEILTLEIIHLKEMEILIFLILVVSDFFLLSLSKLLLTYTML